MSIRYIKETKVFCLDTDHTSYQFRVAEFGFLEHLYYGKKINGTTEHLPVRIRHGFECNPHEAEKDRTICLDVIGQEYPGFGVSDFRVPALSIINTDGSDCVDLRYQSHKIYEGKYSLPELPSFHGGEQGIDTLELTLTDPCTKIAVTLLYGVYESCDLITRAALIKNQGGSTVQINRANSFNLDFDSDQLEILTFYGSWGNERNLERTPVRHGKITVDSARGISSHYQNPAVILCEPDTNEVSGNCVAAVLVYSGNFSITAEVNAFRQTRLTGGINPETFLWELKAGESFTAPEAVMTFSSNGLGQMSRNLHNGINEFMINSKYKGQRRPVLINNWEATMIDFDEEQLVDIAQKAAQLGVEMFVMDDGWFGRRTDEYRGLGDWVCNKDKLPSGIDGLADRINSLGLKFGLWIEPEMISQDSELYEQHPDWCIAIPDRKPSRQRYQLILDMSRTEVVDHIFNQLYEVLKDANVEYIKWDMNRSMTDRFSGALPASRQGELSHRYVLGVYRLMERLTKAFPDILFEGCSGGGGRFDLGVLYYMPQIWCSDDTDAIERIRIQYGTSMIYPISTIGAHVSECPNQQTGRTVSIETRAAAAFFGTFGFELDLATLSDDEQQAVKKQIEYYKQYGEVMAFGDYYRLVSMWKGKEYTAWQSVSKDRTQSVMCYVQLIAGANNGITYIRLQGLDEEQLYYIEELKLTLSGAVLMYAGLPMPVIPADYEARIFTLDAVF